jgi:hypothetical protein
VSDSKKKYKGVFHSEELRNSDVFRLLCPSQRRFYENIRKKCEVFSKPVAQVTAADFVLDIDAKNDLAWVVENNREIEYTYEEAKKDGIKSTTFTRVRDALVRKGLLDMAGGDGLTKGICYYAISNRWKKFGTPDFETVERVKQKRSFGFQKGVLNGNQKKYALAYKMAADCIYDIGKLSATLNPDC